MANFGSSLPPVDPRVLGRATLRLGAYDAVPLGLAVVDADHRVLFWNRTLESWTGVARANVLGRPLAEWNPLWAQTAYREALATVAQTGVETVFLASLHPQLLHPAGPYQGRATALPQGRSSRWIVLSFEDLGPLSRKDQMLREIHHRVKNNLNMISGLVALQRSRDPSQTAGPWDDLQSRISAVSEIHDVLYRSDDLSTGNPAVYLESLTRLLESNLSWSPPLTLDFDLDASIELADDVTVMLGLILAELMTNALKYGLGPEGGRLSVRLVREGDHVIFGLDHSGDRLPRDFDPKASTGLGMVLLGAYAEQLGTELSWAAGDPTRFWLRFHP